MSAREVIYTCPNCTMVFFGPWLTCHMCGYSKIEAARRRELTRIAEQIQDLMEDSEGLMASIKADNDAFDFEEERRQCAIEDARIADACNKADPDAAWRAQPIEKDAPVWGAMDSSSDDEWNQGD